MAEGEETSTTSTTLLGARTTAPNAPTTTPSATTTTTVPSNSMTAGPGGEIRFWDSASPYNSGMFPSYFPAAGTSDGLRSMIAAMSWQEVLTLKRRLWAAGYYAQIKNRETQQAVANAEATPEDVARTLVNLDYVPETGTWGQSVGNESLPKNLLGLGADEKDSSSITYDDAALELALRDYQASGGQQTFDQFVTQRISTFSNTRQEAINQLFSFDILNEAVQGVSLESMGRELTEEELNVMWQQVFNVTPPKGKVGAQRVLTGGNLSSEAIKYGKELSTAYGLVASPKFDVNAVDYGTVMTPAIKDGRAVEFRGDPDSLRRFAEWANQNMGEQGIFEDVQYLGGGDEDDPMAYMTGIRVAFRQGAAVPESDYLGNFGSGEQFYEDDATRFLNAAREPFGASGYQWDIGQPGRYGAYGVPTEVWREYTERLGFNSEDHSTTNQDAVARAYVNDLYNRYNGDWHLVAVAFQGSRDVADMMKSTQTISANGSVTYMDDRFNSLTDVQSANKLIERMGRRGLVTANMGENMKALYPESAGDFDMGDITSMPLDQKSIMARQQKIFRDAYRYEIANAQIFDSLSKDLKMNAVDSYIKEVEGRFGQ